MGWGEGEENEEEEELSWKDGALLGKLSVSFDLSNDQELPWIKKKTWIVLLRCDLPWSIRYIIYRALHNIWQPHQIKVRWIAISNPGTNGQVSLVKKEL